MLNTGKIDPKVILGPNISGMERWITNSVYDQNGGIYSWEKDNEKGYIYNEITGYGIKLFRYLYETFKDPKYLELAQRSIDYIRAQIKNNGGVSRGYIYYVFDTSICLSGILSYYDTPEQIDRRMTRSMLDFIYYNLLNKSPIVLNGTTPSSIDHNHWSLSYGSHLLKCCMAISQGSNIFVKDKQKFNNLIDLLSADILNNFHNGHFHTNSCSEVVYLHSHCYATEGLMYLNRPEYLETIKKSASWLADIQNPNGSFYNWYFSNKKQEELSDITAQAIRIWLWTDKEKFDVNIKKGFGFLKSMQSPEGGIYYGPNSRYINSWVTMFAINALLWYQSGVDLKWLI